MQAFTGLTEDAYRFFWELAFQNTQAFYEENRGRYEDVVKKPLLLLAEALADTAKQVDPSFNVRPSSVLSRIRRDTRYSKDKSPFRDHAWLAYKYQGMPTGESFVLYAEFERTSYGYGMGMYCPQPQYMAEIRKRILTRSGKFLELVHDPKLTGKFELSGEEYRRPKFPDAAKELQPWLNKRRISYCFSSPVLSNTMRPELVDEIKEGFLILRPLYRFIQGLE